MQKGMRANGHVEWHRSSAARHAQHGAMQMQKHLVLKTMLVCKTFSFEKPSERCVLKNLAH